MKTSLWGRTVIAGLGMILPLGAEALSAEYRGRVVDSRTAGPLEARIYLQAADGTWLFVETADRAGRAVPYHEQWVPMPGSVDKHTTISAHEFRVELSPGEYRLTVERGKEYLPLERVVRVGT
ncbi:MAG: hypothetical protein ACP5XB_03080, partial [Isosphaeraceae bacterium]